MKLIKMLAVCCVILGVAFYVINKYEQSPEAIVRAYFEAVKATDYEKAYTYVYPYKRENPITLFDQREIGTLRMFMSRTSFRVVRVVNAEDGTHVIVEVDMPDTEWCLGKALSNIPKKTEDNLIELVWVNMNTIMRQGVRMETYTQELLVRKYNGKMLIINNDKKLLLYDPRLIMRMLIMPYIVKHKD